MPAPGSNPVTLNGLLDEAVARYAAPTAVTAGDRRYGYADLRRDRDGLAVQLARLGVRPGERVALVLPNGSEYITAFFAIVAVGAVVVPVNPTYTSRELARTLTDSGAVVAVVHAAGYDRIRAARTGTALRQVIVVDGGRLDLGDLSYADALTGPQYTGFTTGVSKPASSRPPGC